MRITQLLKIASVFISCALFFGKIGMPAAVIFFEYDFFKVSAVAISGGITGAVVFTYMSDVLLRWWDYYTQRHFKMKKKVFTRGNRRVIKIKKKFGLAGIALLSPVLLSIPLGAFLGDRFYRNKAKVILYMSVSIIIWDIALYFLFYFFHDRLQGLLH